jgi:hypothetical protein
MQATVYANLTTRRLTTTLGGSAISFPAFVQGDTQLDALSTSDRILVCEGIASLYPEQSSEAITARQHAADLRKIERDQLLLTDLLKSS